MWVSGYSKSGEFRHPTTADVCWPERFRQKPSQTNLPANLLGIYLNADDIEADVRKSGFIDLKQFGTETSAEKFRAFCDHSGLSQKAGLTAAIGDTSVAGDRIVFNKETFNSYFASVLAEFLRQQLIDRRETFTFETVMSHVSKVELLRDARAKGYRTYLYYVATYDPTLNVSRVRYRAQTGGHDVPEDKIVDRYYRSLDLLSEAIRNTDRAFIFDNSAHGGNDTWLAEITSGKTLTLKVDTVPDWFTTYVLDKMNVPKNPE